MRIVARGHASWEELRRFWCIDDVFDYLELLDIMDEASEAAAKKIPRQGNHGLDLTPLQRARMARKR